jgi:RNA polymerase sigma factor (sigma-70 family)
MATGALLAPDWDVPPDEGLAMHVADTVAELLGRAAQGDQQAWDEIVDRYTNLLWSVGRGHRLDASSINDVVQTTWLRLLENMDRIREPERLASWLITTARRECLQLLRRSDREMLGWDGELETAAAEAVVAPIDQLLLLRERDAQLWQCFLALSTRCQQLLRVLMAAEPPRYAEVAESLGVPIGSIGPTRMRCLQRLRELADESGYPFALSLDGGTDE